MEEAVQSDDKDAIDEAAKVLYTQESPEEGQSEDEVSNENSENTVDAEYEEVKDEDEVDK